MTIELLDMDPLPSELVSEAYTMVAVRGPGGPIRFRAPVSIGGTGTVAAVTFDQDGSSGSTLTFDQE